MHDLLKKIRYSKRLLTLFLLTTIFIPSNSKAQNRPPVGISIGYFGPIPFEPGFRIGWHTPIHSFESSSLVLNLHTAFYFRNRDNSNLLFGGEIGWRHQKDESKNINTLSIGTAYAMQWEVTGFTVNLQGETVNRTRSLRHQFIPILNYEYARSIGTHWSPFVKFGYGYKISSNAPNSGIAFWEFGTRYSFK